MKPLTILPQIRRLPGLLLLLLLLIGGPLSARADAHSTSIRGVVIDRTTRTPIAMAVVEFPKLGLWAVADQKGEFQLAGIPTGEQAVAVSSLGYITLETTLKLPNNSLITLELAEDNLTMEEVVVTANEASGAMSTTRTIGSNALEHLQVLNASDIQSLLPGGKTINPDLTEETPLSLRDGGETVGNAAFSTAVEVDGVRLSSNASLGEASGVSTRNIASTNIESVEVITGVPSAEYGDVGSGVVKIRTRKGETPWSVQATTNPRTKQLSLAKGFDLGDHRGVLNASAEYARATKNPVSPYTSYTRSGLSLAYSNTFARVLRFEAGVTGNLGGMDTKDDPDAFTGQRSRERDNTLRANTSLLWLLNKRWITDLKFEGSINYADNLIHNRIYVSNGTQLPAVHSEAEGYYFATLLPATHLAEQVIDSKEIDYSLSLKAKWVRSWSEGRGISNLRAGLAWRSQGNIGQGEYYTDPALASHGYRPYPYTSIPYLHNFAFWLEEQLTLPVGSTSMTLMAGLRGEKSFIQGSNYRHTLTWSPRLNLRWRLSEQVSLHGGWGLVEKLPSLGILYPRPEYTDVRMFDLSWAEGSSYVYYTHPCTMLYNPDLRWQQNRNAEFGVDLKFGETRFSLTGYANRTRNPYRMMTEYQPIAFHRYGLPEGYTIPTHPLLKVDSQTGELFIRDADQMDQGWVAMAHTGTNQTFTRQRYQRNGSPIDRYGIELTAQFPTIRPIRTDLRLDAAYGYTKYINEGEAWYYPSVSSTVETGNSFQYVGIYADNGANATVTYNGRRTHSLDVNLTSITHIPSIRLIVTLRLEASLIKQSQNLSCYNGREYAYNVNEAGEPIGGSIYEGDHYTAIRPVAYLDTNGVMHPFTDAEASNPEFAPLMLRSGNMYQYNTDGYDPYFSANLSVTKEIGNMASISVYANNFTNSRRYVTSYATGVKVIRTPGFYYGLTLRLKF